MSVRAWAPFFPGDSKASNTPGAIFEIHLANSTKDEQSGTLAFSFPGFSDHHSRDEIIGWTDLATKPIFRIHVSNGAMPPRALKGRGWKTRAGA